MRSRPLALTIAALTATVVGLSAPADARSPAPPSLTFSPSVNSSFDFGSVDVGESAQQRFTVTNRGGTATGALSVAVSPTGSGFVIPAGGDTCTGVALGPKKSCTIAVTYSPAGEGATDTARLNVTAKKPAATASLSLTGTSPGPGGLSAGCADIATNGYGGSSPPDVELAAGEVVTLTAVPATSDDPFSFAWTRLADGEHGATDEAVAPGSAFLVIPEDGVYRFFYVIGQPASWSWSCSAGS